MQDALGDAEEHLRTALDDAVRNEPGLAEADALASILEEYGSPEEVAKSYLEFEKRIPPVFAPRTRAQNGRSPIQRFVGVLGDPRAYAALFFMLISMVTGIVYFTLATTGVSLSLGFMVLIIGLPFFGLFVFSIQGLALVEGRMIEALLGVRMPRRPATPPKGKGIWGKFVARLTDRRTWTTLFYLILKLPIGILSFTIFITLMAYAIQLILHPVLHYGFGQPFFVINNLEFFIPYWLSPVIILAGFLDLIVILHLAKIAGRGAGALAKAMLVQG